MASVWTETEVERAKANACPHVILSTLPKEGSPRYRGVETCPYCGRKAPMRTRFSLTGKAEDIGKDMEPDLFDDDRPSKSRLTGEG